MLKCSGIRSQTAFNPATRKMHSHFVLCTYICTYVHTFVIARSVLTCDFFCGDDSVDENDNIKRIACINKRRAAEFGEPRNFLISMGAKEKERAKQFLFFGGEESRTHFLRCCGAATALLLPKPKRGVWIAGVRRCNKFGLHPSCDNSNYSNNNQQQTQAQTPKVWQLAERAAGRVRVAAVQRFSTPSRGRATFFAHAAHGNGKWKSCMRFIMVWVSSPPPPLPIQPLRSRWAQWAWSSRRVPRISTLWVDPPVNEECIHLAVHFVRFTAVASNRF